MNKIELLAPAGDLERLKIALLYGADAVYIGGQNYSLRANATNFSLADISEAVIFAHQKAKKVYVAVNIVFHDNDLLGLEEYLIDLDRIGVDGIIISDMAIMTILEKNKYNFEIHISTQVSALNHEVVAYYQQAGATRVVLAREASKNDINKIKSFTGIELECFIHGAMCTSMSGRCVLSNYATNRDSNRGGCSQICRWLFKLDDYEEPFSMTPKDLNMVSYIKEMIDLGVNSFKVEGRMRSIYYIATIIYYYRLIIDEIIKGSLTEKQSKYYLDILNRCANRDSTAQFINKLPGPDEQYFLGRNEVSNQDFLGIVLDYDETKKIVILEQRNYFQENDVVEFFGPETNCFTTKVTDLYDEKGIKIDIARHPQMIVKFKVDRALKPNDMMRIKVFDISNYM